METNTFLWGLVVLIVGIFVSSFGNVMFRFVLAFIGFALGYSLVMWFGDSVASPLQIVIAIVVGGIVAAVFFSIFRFALYMAGGLLGFVLMLGLIGLFKAGNLDLGFFGWLLVLAAAGFGAFFARRLGDIVIVLATALTGAYFVLLGLATLFKLDVDTGNPLYMLGKAFPLVLFVTIALISGLAQYQAFSFRRRVLT